MFRAKHILIAVPTLLEWEPLVKALRAVPGTEDGLYTTPHGAYLVRTGIGKKQSARVLRPFLSSGRFRLVLSTGCAGSLRSGAGPGTIIAGETAGNRNGVDVPLEVPDIAGLVPGLASGRIISVNRPAAPDVKAEIAQRFPDAVGVDMESYWIASLAVQSGMSASVLRVVVDSRREDIPHWRGMWKNPVERIRRFRYRLRAARYCRRLGKYLALWLEDGTVRE